MSTRKFGSGRVQKKVEFGRVPKRWNPGEYWRRVRVSIEKVGSERVLEKVESG